MSNEHEETWTKVDDHLELSSEGRYRATFGVWTKLLDGEP